VQFQLGGGSTGSGNDFAAAPETPTKKNSRDNQDPAKGSLRQRFMRRSADKKQTASPTHAIASSSSYPETGQLKAASSPNKKHHPFGLLRKDLHLHHFFTRNQNARRFSPPRDDSSEKMTPTSAAEVELSRALNQLNSVTRSGEFFAG
jgi:hypothetical protein